MNNPAAIVVRLNKIDGKNREPGTEVNSNEAVSYIWMDPSIDQSKLGEVIHSLLQSLDIQTVLYPQSDYLYYSVTDRSGVVLTLPPETTIILRKDSSVEFITTPVEDMVFMNIDHEEDDGKDEVLSIQL
ncbi:hypothetical protein [Proteus mirabilis]|uniref:hypothetical protein n=1 Tax=Proteus mirabilis TaxID=584 RepID=UPI0034D3F4C7